VTNRRLFLQSAAVTAIWGCVKSSSAQVDNRTLQQRIDDFLTLRLTREVIDNEIFSRLRFAFRNLTGSAEDFMPLFRAVLESRFSYEALWHRLDEFDAELSGAKRKSWARQVAKEAARVNLNLARFRAAVLALNAGSRKILDPNLDRILTTYAMGPAKEEGYYTFLRGSSSGQVERIVSESRDARDIVASAHNCFLCFMHKQFNHPSPVDFDCSKCTP
jgi:hypothetical protein